jgi:biopolymer transport protein ExbD
MPIRKPGRVLLQKSRGRARPAGRRSNTNPSLALVPFIDLLVTLVVFLLSTASSNGELATPQTLQLPSAEHTLALESRPIIAIDGAVVALDGHRVADTPSLMMAKGPVRLDGLIEDLRTLERNWSVLHADEPFPSTVILEADGATDFRVLRSVMYSTTLAGYANTAFAVRPRG